MKEIPKQLNLKSEIDIQSLTKFIEDLEGLQLSIAALDGDITIMNEIDQKQNISKISKAPP